MTSDLVDLGQGRRPWNRSLALWQFSREMQVNDVIIAQYGGLHVVGWGYVTGDYTYDPDRPEYPHRRPVIWHACDPPITAPHRSVAKALTDFSPYLPFVHQAFSKIDKRDGGPGPQPEPLYTIDTALEGSSSHESNSIVSWSRSDYAETSSCRGLRGRARPTASSAVPRQIDQGQPMTLPISLRVSYGESRSHAHGACRQSFDPAVRPSVAH